MFLGELEKGDLTESVMGFYHSRRSGRIGACRSGRVLGCRFGTSMALGTCLEDVDVVW